MSAVWKFYVKDEDAGIVQCKSLPVSSKMEMQLDQQSVEPYEGGKLSSVLVKKKSVKCVWCAEPPAGRCSVDVRLYPRLRSSQKGYIMLATITGSFAYEGMKLLCQFDMSQLMYCEIFENIRDFELLARDQNSFHPYQELRQY